MNFNNLKEITTVNSRTRYDLRYSEKTGKFNLSQTTFDRLDMNNHGFRLFMNEETPVLALVPNEEATIHKGRSDADNKGLAFTANVLVDILGIKEDAYYLMNEHIQEENTYITLERMGTENNEEVSEEENEQSITY